MAKRVLIVSLAIEIEDDDLDAAEIEAIQHDLPASIENRISDDDRIYLGNVHRTTAAGDWATDLRGDLADWDYAMSTWQH